MEPECYGNELIPILSQMNPFYIHPVSNIDCNIIFLSNTIFLFSLIN
jgi:hypothetical protein